MAREAFLELVFFLLAYRGCSLAQSTSQAAFIPSANWYWDLRCGRDRGYLPEQAKPGLVLMVLTLESEDGYPCRGISGKEGSDECHKGEKTAQV